MFVDAVDTLTSCEPLRAHFSHLLSLLHLNKRIKIQTNIRTWHRYFAVLPLLGLPSFTLWDSGFARYFRGPVATGPFPTYQHPRGRVRGTGRCQYTGIRVYSFDWQETWRSCFSPNGENGTLYLCSVTCRGHWGSVLQFSFGDDGVW
jgi:hypothetical protein